MEHRTHHYQPSVPLLPPPLSLSYVSPQHHLENQDESVYLEILSQQNLLSNQNFLHVKTFQTNCHKVLPFFLTQTLTYLF